LLVVALSEKEAAMEIVYPYLIVFLAGIATPFVVLRRLIRGNEADGSGCLLNICIAGIGSLILLVVYSWWLAS
jgi:hypothetical protein